MEVFTASIVWRLNAIILSVVLVAMTGMAATIAYYNYSHAVDVLEARANERLKLLTITIDELVWNLDQEAIARIADELLRDDNVIAFAVYAEGQESPLVMETRDLASNLSFPQLALLSDVIYRHGSIMRDGRSIGELHLAISTATARHELVSATATLAAFVIALAALLFLCITQVVIRIIKTPLQALEDSADKLAKGALDEVIDTSRRDELGRLARAFASMRNAIRQKITDLNRLNETGEKLAQARIREDGLRLVAEVLRDKFSLLSCAAYLRHADDEGFSMIMSLGGRSNEYPDFVKETECILVQPLSTQTTLLKHPVSTETGHWPAFSKQSKTVTYLPLTSQTELKGFFIGVGQSTGFLASAADQDFATTIARLMLTTLSNLDMLHLIEEQNRTLEARVKERTAELQSAQQQLVEAARQAGMAEIATEVLHNVGNTLNSVRVASQSLSHNLDKSVSGKLTRINELIKDNFDGLKSFLFDTAQGEKIFPYYFKIESELVDENLRNKTQNDIISRSTETIHTIIQQQQQHAKGRSIAEDIQLSDVVDEVLFLINASLSKHHVIVEKVFHDMDKIAVQKAKLIHVLYNLLINAKDALKNNDESNRKVTISVGMSDDDHVFIEVSDNGVGIEAEHLERIFQHGFSSKRGGHGFGLHSCANYMKEMQGSISVVSEGLTAGAKFVLLLPVKAAKKLRNSHS